MSAFVERLRVQGSLRYHDRHPFHVAMHDGRLTRRQIHGWVLNRYYYQTRIPIKDAIILSNSEDPAFRRMWLHRIVDHDGTREGEGGLADWLRLAEGVGLDSADVRSLKLVLPRVRAACDDYVSLARTRTLVEAVASSLTEFFAPDLMLKRLTAWEKHYTWVDRDALAYFRRRIIQGRHDAEEALAFVERSATTIDLQNACVAALVRKCDILRSMLDAVAGAYGAPE